MAALPAAWTDQDDNPLQGAARRRADRGVVAGAAYAEAADPPQAPLDAPNCSQPQQVAAGGPLTRS
jgi:hypothetical protein